MAAVAKITFLVERGKKMNLNISTEIINFSQEAGWQALSEEEKNLGSQWENKALRKTLQAPLKSVHDETMLDPPHPQSSF